MSFEFFVACRYLRARRKQMVISFTTVISILGIMTGVAALIIVLSLYAGLIEDIQQKILGATAHVTIQSRESGGLRDYETLMEQVVRVKGVRQVTPAIFVQALVNSGVYSSGIILKGVDPNREPDILGSYTLMTWGKFDDLSSGRSVILGAGLAKRLGIGVRKRTFVNLIVPQGVLSPLGMMPRIQRFRVVGVIKTGLYDLDNSWAYVSLSEARRMVKLPDDAVQCLEVRTTDIYNVEQIQEKISAQVGKNIATSNWIEKNRTFFSAMKLEKWSMFLAIGLIVLVAALNIISTLIMMVMEKNRDIAILRAMGATGKQIKRIFMWQGLLIGLVGAMLGSGLGVSLSWAADRYQWISMDPEVYMIPNLPFHISFWDVLLVATAAVFISFLATFYPSRQAVRVDPVEAIRYE